MQFSTLVALLFAGTAIAAPLAVIEMRALPTTGINNYGDDGVPAKTTADGKIVRVSDGAPTANGKA